MRIAGRQHFKVAYSRNPDDQKLNREAGKAVSQALSDEYGTGMVKLDDAVTKLENDAKDKGLIPWQPA